jgi:hypothetical protein
MWFKFLLFPGKTWAQNAHWETPADDVYGIEDVRGKVVGWEKVTVPAGTYKALRVELRDRVIETGGVYDLVTLTYGYVPDVNRFVKYSYRSILRRSGGCGNGVVQNSWRVENLVRTKSS